MHILVNNAGATWGAPLEEYPGAAWDKVLDVNVKAPFYLTRAMLPQLEAAAAAGRPGQGDQRGVDRRDPGADDADVRVLGQQGGGCTS